MLKKIIAGFVLALSLFGIATNITGTNSLAIFTLPTAEVKVYE